MRAVLALQQAVGNRMVAAGLARYSYSMTAPPAPAPIRFPRRPPPPVPVRPPGRNEPNYTTKLSRPPGRNEPDYTTKRSRPPGRDEPDYITPSTVPPAAPSAPTDANYAPQAPMPAAPPPRPARLWTPPETTANPKPAPPRRTAGGWTAAFPDMRGDPTRARVTMGTHRLGPLSAPREHFTEHPSSRGEQYAGEDVSSQSVLDEFSDLHQTIAEGFVRGYYKSLAEGFADLLNWSPEDVRRYYAQRDLAGRPQAKTSYLSEAEREAFEVVPGQEMRYRSGRLLSTRGMRTNWNSEHGIYVLSTDGRLYVGSHRAAMFHHTSFLAGADVAAAGEMRVIDGKPTRITNKSGHYKPKAWHLVRFLQFLQRRGVALSGVQLAVHGSSARPRNVTDALGWLAAPVNDHGVRVRPPDSPLPDWQDDE